MKLLLQDKRLLREFLFRGHKAHTMDYYLRADVCKYRPEVGNMIFLKNPKKIL